MLVILFVHALLRELCAHIGSLLLLLSFLESQNPQFPTSVSFGHPLLAGGVVVTGYTCFKSVGTGDVKIMRWTPMKAGQRMGTDGLRERGKLPPSVPTSSSAHSLKPPAGPPARWEVMALLVDLLPYSASTHSQLLPPVVLPWDLL